MAKLKSTTIYGDLSVIGDLIVNGDSLSIYPWARSGDTTAIPVSKGGTGWIAITENSYLKGNGTGALIPRTYVEVRTDLGLGTNQLRQYSFESGVLVLEAV